MTTPALVSAGSASSAIDSATPAFGQETTAGNLLLAWANSNNPSSSFPLSISGSGWTLVESNGGSYNWTALWMKADCSADESAPTFSDSGYLVTASLAEFSGVATSSALDQHGSYYGFPAGASAGGDSTAAGELVVALAVWNGGNSSPSLGMEISGSGNFPLTDTALIAEGEGSAAPYWIFAYGVDPDDSSDAPVSCSPSTSEYENEPVCIVAAFVPAS